MAAASPSAWTVEDVQEWAENLKLSDETIATLAENEIDGATLVTLTKEELRSELGIRSLPARRCLWEWIQNLKAEQVASDFSAAMMVHENEIMVLASDISESSPDEASGRSKIDATIIYELKSDAARQRQIIDDHIFAHRMQRSMTLGQQIYEDAEAARQEQQRLDQLLIQSECDREFARLLESGNQSGLDFGETTTSVPSLFGICVQSCVQNHINVAEAFATKVITPITFNVDDELPEESTSVVANKPKGKKNFKSEPKTGKLKREESSDKPGKLKREESSDTEPDMYLLERCNVCYEENIPGYILACNHSQCVDCMRRLFRAALRDISLLPLQCCEIPIDMNCGSSFLNSDELGRIRLRIQEMEASKKMYCTSCGAFINLDLVDVSHGLNDLACHCGTLLCLTCESTAHPGLTCDQNKAALTASDEALQELSRLEGWKQCPKCAIMIELRSGCNHMTCRFCRHEFCFRCLSAWATSRSSCSSGQCELWDENRLIEAGEARVRAEEDILGEALPEPVRQIRLQQAYAGLRANERCNHVWRRQGGYHGECENCRFEMFAYGMVCVSDCGSTVCYTCAHHRIPQRGWR